jgi:predicted DsbA family dithiol-disulfide isomerase
LGKGDEFHKAVFQAYFADGRNIADISVLKEIIGTIGLDGRIAEQALAERTFKEAVDRDWEYSRTCGVTAVPTFMIAKRLGVGAQPYQALLDLVRAAGGEYAGMMGPVQQTLWPIAYFAVRRSCQI